MVSDVNRAKLYDELYKSFKNANSNKSAKQKQDETNTFWNGIKRKDNCADLVKQKMLELGKDERKTDASLLTFWGKVSSGTCFSFNLKAMTAVYSTAFLQLHAKNKVHSKICIKI